MQTAALLIHPATTRLFSFAASMVILDYAEAIFELTQRKTLDIKDCGFSKFLNTCDLEADISHYLAFGYFSFTLSFAKN